MPIPHLILLPELAQDIAVNGILHKADVQALDAEIEVPKPKHEAVNGSKGNGLKRLRLPEPGTAGVRCPQPGGSLSPQHRCSWEHWHRSVLSQQPGQLPEFCR